MKHAIAALAASLALAPPAARGEAALSLNHELTGGMAHGACMNRAEDAMRLAGLLPLAPTSEAAWGESEDRKVIATIYCLKTRDVAMFVVGGPGTARTSPLLDRLLKAWRGQR